MPEQGQPPICHAPVFQGNATFPPRMPHLAGPNKVSGHVSSSMEPRSHSAGSDLSKTWWYQDARTFEIAPPPGAGDKIFPVEKM